MIRLDAIGDALSCTPLIAALRDEGHELSALLTTGNCDIFARRTFANTHVMHRIPWPKHGYTARTEKAALGAIRDARYEIALIASEEPAAYRFASAAGIPVRIGFHNGWQKPLKSWWARRKCTRALYRPANLPTFPEHEVQVQFALGKGLHRESAPTCELSRLRPLILDIEQPRGGFAVLQLTKKWLSPDRPPEVVAQWLRRLQAQLSWRFVAASAEREILEPVALRARITAEYFDDLHAWKEAIAQAEVLVTPDTGAAHLAGMLGTPVVDIFERAAFGGQARRWAPWAAPARVRTFPQIADYDNFPAVIVGAIAALAAQSTGTQ